MEHLVSVAHKACTNKTDVSALCQAAAEVSSALHTLLMHIHTGRKQKQDELANADLYDTSESKSRLMSAARGVADATTRMIKVGRFMNSVNTIYLCF
jgi:hypothetical protein